MNKKSMIGAVAVAAFSMVSLTMATTYTWTGVNDDWADAGNWDANGIPAVTGASNYVGGANNDIVINGGGVQPAANIPDMVHGGAGESPKVTLGANAELTLKWGNTGTWHGMTGSGVMATVGSGATLKYDLINYISNTTLAREPNGLPAQTFNVNGGELHFINGGRLDFASSSSRTSAFNLDGGDVVFDHRYGSPSSTPYMQVWGCGSVASASTSASLITLDNNSTFGTARFWNIKWSDGNAAIVFDILDEGSKVKVATGGGSVYQSAADVEADFGTIFKSSTLGDANLLAVEDGGVVTVSVSLSGTPTTTYVWTGVNDDWSDPANWGAAGVPATTGSSNYLGGGVCDFTITSGGVQPASNIPDMAHGSLGFSPKVTLQANTALALTWAPGAGWNGMKGAGTMATVATNAVLTYNLDHYVSYASLSRDPMGIPLQTFNVNGGQLVFNHGGRLDLAFNDTRTSAFNLNGGDVVFDHRYGSTTSAPFFEVLGYGNDSGAETNENTITLNNGSSFGIARLVNTKWSSGYPSMVFDIQDTNSTVNISTTGGDYTSVAAVEADFGSVFTSSTFGDAYLQANLVNGVITVSVMSGAPVPTPYEAWLSGYNLGAFTNMLDDAENGGIGDGLNNLTEYALGSAPDVVDVPADVLPKSVVDGATLKYIYQRQNPKDANLTYTVLDGTDLVNGGLVNTNTTETVSAAVDGFETVTNEVSTATQGQQFMQLKMELSD
ncbi:hypothetical protein P4B35_02080 [Pontiellaceae bacterium B12227]|nr:hypothetical protein [Pontiellaceae bacterium B12227]